MSPQSRSGASVSACLNWEKSEMARFPGKFFWLSTCPCSLILPPWRRSAFPPAPLEGGHEVAGWPQEWPAP